MKLEIEVIDSETAKITLDGKTVIVVSDGSSDGSCDLNELPENTIGCEIIDGCWESALKLIQVKNASSYSVWKIADQETLEEVWEYLHY